MQNRFETITVEMNMSNKLTVSYYVKQINGLVLCDRRVSKRYLATKYLELLTYSRVKIEGHSLDTMENMLISWQLFQSN